jgi:nitrate reductase NapAB chaperone NapD
MKEFTFVVSSATTPEGGGLPVVIRAKTQANALARLATLINMEKVVNIKLIPA